MADAAISSAVELLGNLLIEKVKSLRGVEGKVRLLKDELESMQSFLIDANRKQAKDEGVRGWIRKIREVAQDAEDIIDMFLINVEYFKSRGLLKRCTGFPKRMYHLHQIGDEIDSICARLDAIDRSRERYGIQIVEEAADSPRVSQVELWRRLRPWQKDEHLVGIEDAVKKMLGKVMKDEKKRGLSVVVIQGMGGIGKSTLAREIYNHPKVVDTDSPFDRRGWVVVSSEFTPQETIKQLIFQLCRSDEEKKKVMEEIQKLEQSMKDKHYILQNLQEMLYRQLEGTNYFIVMDDVWDQDHWDYFNCAFPNQQDKTRLILTTRNKIIAKPNQYVLKMKLLDPKKSWELFLKKVFINNSNGTCPEELESIGRKILEKCDGLPLAISVVGGLLVDSQHKRRWQEVLDQIDSNISENYMPNILGLSYQNLSPQLKSCFLCLAFFKEDLIIHAKGLVNIWAAQGIIQEKGSSRTVEEIGRGYLNELINRSLLQIQDLTIDGQVQSFRLHDLLREVCINKAEEEMSMKIVKGEGESSFIYSYKPRHHVVYNRSHETTLSLNPNKYLRSLFLLNVVQGYYPIDIPSLHLKNFQLLKILYIDGFGISEFPNSFRYLVGLKYLRIHTNRSWTHLKLPGWLARFKKLEFLYVEFVRFSNVVLKMESLREFGTHHAIGRPMKVENWKSIESLKGIRLEDLVVMSSELIPNSHLRELHINVVCDNFVSAGFIRMARASLQKMANLVKLHLYIDTQYQWGIMSQVVQLLISNLESVTSLKLETKEYISFECPAASVFPPNLSHLTLVRTQDVSMEELGKLPKLQYLTVKHSTLSQLVERMKILHDGFPCLKALSLKEILFLRGIDVEKGGMPCLKQLRIRDCPNLENTMNLPKHIIVSFA